MSEVIECVICDKKLEKINCYFESNKTKYSFCSQQCSDDFNLRFSLVDFSDTYRHGVIMLSDPLLNDTVLLVKSVLYKVSSINEVTVSPDRILVSYSVRLPVLNADSAEAQLIKKIQNQQVLMMKNLLLDVELAIKDHWFERMPKHLLTCDVEL